MSVSYCDCPLCRSMPPASARGALTPAGYGTNEAVVTFVPEFPATETQPTIFDLVKADLDKRDKKGAAGHGGSPLLAAGNKDWLREAYEEALDLVVYLRGALAERGAKK